MQCITSDKFDRKGRRVKRSGEGEIMVIIACVRHQLSVMGMRTQYALGPHNQTKLKALERKSSKRQPRQGTSQT